jgi:SsrA-binding protein
MSIVTDTSVKDHSKTINAMSITQNKKAYHDYFIEEKYEAGIVLSGWEVKAIRAGRVQLKDTYVVVRDGELWLLGGHISPLLSASTHVNPDPTRTRKLLLKADEIKRLIGKVEQKGFTLVPLDLHYTRGKIKCEIALARGKAEYDKRHAEKDREWQREKQRVISQINHK